MDEAKLTTFEDVDVLSGHWIEPLLRAEPGRPTKISLDLGISVIEADVTAEAIVLPDGRRLERPALEDLKPSPEDCFVLRGETIEKIYIFSDEYRRYYKLWHARADWPSTIVINNAPMHVILSSSPLEDARRKLDAVMRLSKGKDLAGLHVLDTCFGLGYTARLAADSRAQEVITCEIDPHVLQVARLNPWSRPAFTHAAVSLRHVDSQELIARSPDGDFDLVVHDPPTLTMAGELYSDALYGELHRVLSPEGRLYHYTGDPGGRHGRDLAAKVARRLKRTGFKRVKKAWGGVVGIKG